MTDTEAKYGKTLRMTPATLEIVQRWMDITGQSAPSVVELMMTFADAHAQKGEAIQTIYSIKFDMKSKEE